MCSKNQILLHARHGGQPPDSGQKIEDINTDAVSSVFLCVETPKRPRIQKRERRCSTEPCDLNELVLLLKKKQKKEAKKKQIKRSSIKLFFHLQKTRPASTIVGADGGLLTFSLLYKLLGTTSGHCCPRSSIVCSKMQRFCLLRFVPLTRYQQ